MMNKYRKYIVIGIVCLVLVIGGGVGFRMWKLSKFDEDVEMNLSKYIETSDDKYYEELEAVFKGIKNRSSRVVASQKIVLDRFREEFDNFLDRDFDDIKDFESQFQDLHNLVEEIYAIDVENKDGEVIHLLDSRNREELLGLFESEYDNIANYYGAITLVKEGEYNKAIEKLESISNSEVMESKASSYMVEIETSVVAKINEEVKDLESQSYDNDLKKYKSINDYLVLEKGKWDFDISGNEGYKSLVSKYKESFDSVLIKDISYDVSNFTEVSLDGLLDMIDSDQVVLVYLGRSNCPYCVKFVPVLNQTLDYLKQDVYYVDAKKIDYDSDVYEEFVNVATKEYSSGYPTFVAFKEGKVVSGLVGVRDYYKIIDFYKKLGISVK